LGSETVAFGDASTAMGYKTDASGKYSTAMGYNTEASGDWGSVAMGWEVVASGAWGSTAMGNYTEASGEGSTSMGSSTVASGKASTAMGEGTNANTLCMTAIGRYNWVGANNFNNWSDTDPIFTIGIGQLFLRQNAMTVLKGGQVGLQSVTAPTYALHLPDASPNGEGKALARGWDTFSDTRVKSNQQPIPYGLAEVLRLTPKTYFHHNSTIENGSIVIAPEGKQDIGLVAQEVYEIIPEVVSKPENEQDGL